MVDAYLPRIERFDPRLNAYITVLDDHARTRATLLEDELQTIGIPALEWDKMVA